MVGVVLIAGLIVANGLASQEPTEQGHTVRHRTADWDLGPGGGGTAPCGCDLSCPPVLPDGNLRVTCTLEDLRTGSINKRKGTCIYMNGAQVWFECIY